MIGAFDRSNLIFTRRSNDLIFQTAAVKLLMAKEQRTRYTDFSYQHHTVREDAVVSVARVRATRRRRRGPSSF